MADLKTRIEEILANAYATGHDQTQAAQAYSESFQREGLRKSQFVVNRIKELDCATQESLKEFTALSVGGADGSDLLALVKNTHIRRAILLEHDNMAAELATTNTRPLIEAEGGTLHVIVGDAVQQLESTVERLKAEREHGVSGLPRLLRSASRAAASQSWVRAASLCLASILGLRSQPFLLV